MNFNKKILTLTILVILIILSSCKPDTPDNNDLEYDVVIVGGGLSGLISGYMLKNKNVLIIVKEDSVGGNIKYREWKGFRYSGMMEYMSTPSPEESAFFNKLGIAPVQIPAPAYGIAKNGQIYFSSTILNFLGTEEEKQNYIYLYSNIENFCDLFGYAVWNFQTDLENFSEYDALSFSDWLESGSYSQAVKEYINTENRTLFGVNNIESSMLFSVPGLYNYLPETTTFEENSYSFTNGFYDLISTLSDSLNEMISLNSEILDVSINSNLSVIIKYRKDGLENYITAKSLVFAIPAPKVEALVSTGFSEEVLNALSSVSYKPIITANLFTSERLWNKTWRVTCIDEFYVSFYDAIRTQVALNYNKESILGFSLAPTLTNDPSLLSYQDEDIIQNIFSGMEKYFPEIRSKVTGYDIQRNIEAFPVFTPDYYQILKILNEDNSTLGPLFLTGDYLVYPSFEGIYISAKKTSRRIINYLDK